MCIRDRLGVSQVLLAINKMDLVNYSKDAYDSILADYHQFAEKIGVKNITAIPVSALAGDNITENSEKMSWYKGPTLMEHLETTPLHQPDPERGFSMPVQWVNRPNLDFRGFAGEVASGVINVGDAIKVLPSGKQIKGYNLKNMDFSTMRKYIRDHFSQAKWEDVKMENLCDDSVVSKKKGGANIIKYTPTQRFIKEYFSPQCPVKGMLLWHSTGTGKTCSAIAAASSTFAVQDYTILWAVSYTHQTLPTKA